MNLRYAMAAIAILAAAGQANAAKPRVNDVCQADFHKLCPDQAAGRGVVIRCARAHLSAVSPDCKSAVDTADALNAARRAAKASRRASAKTTAQSRADAAG
jgi:hypothetical protein